MSLELHVIQGDRCVAYYATRLDGALGCWPVDLPADAVVKPPTARPRRRGGVLAVLALGLAMLGVATAARGNDLDVSPATGAIYPSTPYSPPTVIVVPPRTFQPTCPLDGPGAWSCDRRERHRSRR